MGESLVTFSFLPHEHMLIVADEANKMKSQNTERAKQFQSSLFQKPQTLQRMYYLINVFETKQFGSFDCYCFQRAEITQTALINVLSQLLNHFCVYGKVFYGLTCKKCKQ